MKNIKDFDAVKMMREIRDKKYREYKSNPDLRKQRLEVVREKYAGKIKMQKSMNLQE
jgi:hypothetical protein